ncbi:MAG: NAD(P)H-binding protein [Nitrospinae bacterium]|nr:NAD(P)H-binding protein [Nitrospinota bacterium]
MAQLRTAAIRPDGRKPIDIAITGANGAVGKALIERLGGNPAIGPVRLRALVRELGRSEHLRDLPAERIQVDYDDPENLIRALEGADCVAHLAGSLVPRAGDSLLGANLLTTKNVAEASIRGGVKSFVFLSFPGADARSENEYLRTKGQAEDVIAENFASGAIFRVPMILGADTPAINQIKRLLRSSVVPLVAGGAVRIQPIYLGDVISAIEWAILHPEAPLNRMNLVGPETLYYRELLMRAGLRLGKRPRILPIPRGPARLASSVIGRLSPSSPMSRTVFDIIFYEHLCNDEEAGSGAPIARTGVDEILDLSLPNRE